jgi:[protein-PII] uridylyltransferase
LGRDGRSRSLDIFWVRGPEDAEQVSRLLPKLERELERIVVEAPEPAVLERRALIGARANRAPKARFSTEVHVDNKSATNYTIIEVITQDRPALLFCLSNALQRVGLSIWFAKINTEGERVIDVFYVSNGSGQKVVDGGEIERIRVAILAAVQRLEAQILGPGVVATAASS